MRSQANRSRIPADRFARDPYSVLLLIRGELTVEAKIEEIRPINRAKWLLIECLHVTEPEAPQPYHPPGCGAAPPQRGRSEHHPHISVENQPMDAGGKRDMLSHKENMLRMYSGEMPEYIPMYGFKEVKCSAFIDVKKPGCKRDEFGVEYTGKEEIFGGAPIPFPGHYVLTDIRQWRDKIKAPDLSGVDWEQLAKKDLAGIDRSTTGIVFFWGKIFQRLMDFMGFSDGLLAIATEPEECYALFDYLCDFHCEVLKNVCRYYKPDSVCIPDDTATARAPFISRETYQRLVKPFHAREAEIVLNSGCHLDMHDCGRCEDFIDDWLDFGVQSWNPAQPSNDLAGVKQKFGRRLIINGGWDSQSPVSYAEVDEDVLREALIRYVDEMAPNGGFIFAARAPGKLRGGVKDKMDVVMDVYQNYAKNWYLTH